MLVRMRGEGAVSSPLDRTRNKSKDSADSLRAEVAISPLSYPVAKGGKESQDVTGSQKTKDIIGALNATVVKDAMKKALKKASKRSMKTKHLRRHLREIFSLPKSFKKWDLEKLFDRALDSNKSRLSKNGKVITLSKHRIANS